MTDTIQKKQEQNIMKIFERVQHLINIAKNQGWNYHLCKTPEDLFEKTELYIDYSSDKENPQSIPEEFGLLSNLTALRLAWKFGDIHAITKLENLKELTLFNMNLEQAGIWDTILCLKNLEKLTFKCCYLPYIDGVPEDQKNWSTPRQIPSTIAQLTNLRELSVPETRVDVLPDTLGVMSNLEILNLDTTGTDYTNHSTFTELPNTIGGMSSLRVLTLKNTDVKHLPASVCLLPALEVLKLQRMNQLESLPNELGNVQSLKELFISNTKVSQLPESIGNLHKLETLYINQLSSLPQSITQCTALRYMEVHGEVSELPSDLGCLNNLVELQLGMNQITCLPNSITECVNLEILDLSSNALTELPATIGTLSKLRKLFLSSNALTSIPTSIGQLSSLEVLRVSRNELSQLPDTLHGCQKLQRLDASYNKLASLPSDLDKLKDLTDLNLCENQIQEISQSIMSLEINEEFTLNIKNNPIKVTKWGYRCVEAIVQKNSAVVRELLDSGVDPNIDLGVALDWTGDMIQKVGPPLLFLAAISEKSDILVPMLLEAGADPQKSWIYSTDWDSDDCYLDTDSVSIVTSLEALFNSGKDYFKMFSVDDIVHLKIAQLKDLGFFDADGNALYSPPTEATINLLRNAVRNQ